MEEMTKAIHAATSPNVQLWMNWMFIVFAASILFVWKYPVARIVLVTFILTALVGLVVFNLTKEPHLIGISHLLLWTPLAFYLYFKVIKSTRFNRQSVYGIWIMLLLMTIVISLVFDVRDVFLVLTGNR